MNNETSAVWHRLSDLPYVFSGPPCSGIIRTTAEDFQVDEVLGFEPDGDGEHALIQVQKRNQNTDWLAGQLASLAGVPRRDISFAGLKDRNAITTQWFSIRLAGKSEPDWSALNGEDIKVLESHRHRRKLRRGVLKGNRFTLNVRALEGSLEKLEEILSQVQEQGFPNYFGEQRFGRDYGNLSQAERLFAGELKKVSRHKRGLYLSAIRSQIFNQVLGRRIDRGDWNILLNGELAMLDGTHSWFPVEQVDDELVQRLSVLDIHPTGPLWGRGRTSVEGEIAELESQLTEPFPSWLNGLETFGLQQERRALRANATDLKWTIDGDVLNLSFRLPPGCYATMLLREMVNCR